MVPGVRVTDGPPATLEEVLLHFCTLWVETRYQMGRAHCGDEVPNRSRTVGKILGCLMEEDSMEAYTTSMEINATFMEVHLLPWRSMKSP